MTTRSFPDISRNEAQTNEGVKRKRRDTTQDDFFDITRKALYYANEEIKNGGETEDGDRESKEPGLRCPFFMRRPNENRRDACQIKSYPTMGRLKQHLDRVHSRPLQCERCWKDMQSPQAYTQHIQQDPICDRELKPSDDRICKQQLRRLNLNRLPFCQAKNVSEKWKILYRELFPEDESVPSPYGPLDSSVVEEQYFVHYLEKKLKEDFGDLLPKFSKDYVPLMVEQCRAKARIAAIHESESPPNIIREKKAQNSLSQTQQTPGQIREGELDVEEADSYPSSTLVESINWSFEDIFKQDFTLGEDPWYSSFDFT